MVLSSKNCMPMMDHLPIVYTKLDKALIAKAEKELRETEENLSKGLRQLRQLIEKESVVCPKDDAFLAMFLRAKKFDVPKSFQQLKAYSEMRPGHDRAYGFPDMDTVRSILATTVCGLLPKRDHEGRVVLFFRVDQFESERFTGEDVLRTMKLLVHFVLQYPATQINGVCFISDSRLKSFEHAQVMIKQLARNFTVIRSFPARIKRVDNVNSNLLFRAGYTLVKTLLSSRMMKRFAILGDEKEALLKIYPASILPEEFGGTLGPLRDIEHEWMPEFEKYASKYKTESTFFLKDS